MSIGKDFATDFADLLVNVATIETRSEATDSMLGETVTWSTSYTAVPCSLQGFVQNGVVQDAHGQQVSSVTHIAIFNRSLTVHNGDRLTDEAGTKYQVIDWVSEGGVPVESAIYLKRVTEA
jgi:ribosomal protein L35AE/L33A